MTNDYRDYMSIQNQGRGLFPSSIKDFQFFQKTKQFKIHFIRLELVLQPIRQRDYKNQKDMPISLLNLAANTLDKTIADKVLQNAKMTMQHQQKELFFWDKWFNIYKLIKILYHIKHTKDKSIGSSQQAWVKHLIKL